MKKTLSLLMAIVMILGSLLTLSACAPKDDGAEINIYLGDKIFDFDPSDYYVSDGAEQILSLIYETLFRVSEWGFLKCAAASDYKIDKDERSITIDIRESYWSDGVQVQAADFVYAWCERIINPQYANPAAALFYGIEGVKEAVAGEVTTADISIKATGMTEITITYCDGADPKAILKNLASVATAPVRQDVVDAAPTYWSKTVNTIVTNGPFKIKSYNRVLAEFELARNVGYHQAPTKKDYDNKVKPGLLYTSFNMYGEDINVSYSDIENKVKFIMTDMPLAERAEYKKKAKVEDHTSTYTYVFNTGRELFADKNVRLALSAAIDREEIVKAVTFGKAADGFIPTVSGGAKTSFISSGADMELARNYLAEVDPELLARNKAFTVKIDFDEQSIKIAELVEAAWEELGFEVTIEVVEPIETQIYQDILDGSIDDDDVSYTTILDSGIQSLVKDAATGNIDYDVIAVDWQMYGLEPTAGLASLTSALNGCGVDFTGGDIEQGIPDSMVYRSNIAGWADAEYDRLVSELLSADTKKERKSAAAAAEKYLMGEMPVCPIIFNQNFVFKSWKISGISVDRFGNFGFSGVKLFGYSKHLKPDED